MSHQSFEAKKFLVKFLKIAIVLIMLDFIIGHILEYYYFKIRSGLYHNITFIIDSTKAQTLVFGSSRANHHYVPQIFENKLNTTFYNCGNDGIGLIYDAALIKAVTARYQPKRILVDLLPNEFSFDESERLSYLLPYKDNPSIRPYILKKSGSESLKLIASHIYPYNSLPASIVVGNIKPISNYEINAQGYEPLNGDMDSSTREKLPENSPLIQKKINIFKELLSYLSKRGIICYVIISPDYDILDNNKSIKIAKDYCSNYKNIHLIDLSNDTNYVADQSLFKDSYHLNNQGASKFSNEICTRIQIFENMSDSVIQKYSMR